MGTKYVCEGATVKCSAGSSVNFQGLTVTNKGNVKIKNKLMANITDTTIVPDSTKTPNNCDPLTAQTGSAVPCSPTLERKWSGGKENVKVNGEYALLSTSTIICNTPKSSTGTVGTISITNPNQTTVTTS